jgi:pyruvyltransferase
MIDNKNFFYFVPYGGNFGDELVPYLINKLIPNANYIKNETSNLDSNRQIISSIGSILHLIPDGSYVWGTGHNPRYKKVAQKLKIFATRGPLSLKHLKNYGYNPEDKKIVFGDPALLIPKLIPEWLDSTDIKHEITFIPHHNDIKFIENIPNHINIVRCNEGVEKVIQNIRESKYIVSSSLHGIIVGEMLNKPSFWLQLPGSKKSETEEKYQDYYLSTNRLDITPYTNFNQINYQKYTIPIYNSTKLIHSFYEAYLQ